MSRLADHGELGLVPKTRAGLSMMGLWTLMKQAEAALLDCASDVPPDKSTLRWRAAELRGAAEVLRDIAESEAAS